jgi:hypothetical protein
MVEKCLNPACSARFHSLKDGKVFAKQLEDSSRDHHGEHPHQIAYFWLCGSCCRTMTVAIDKEHQIGLAPLPTAAATFSHGPAAAPELHTSSTELEAKQ